MFEHITELIIGAGPAGHSCAQELAKSGRNPVVLEAGTQVGGVARTEIYNQDHSMLRGLPAARNLMGENHILSGTSTRNDRIMRLSNRPWRKPNRAGFPLGEPAPDR